MGKKQPELYRIPRKPGYLGGYNWRAVALGCLLLVVVNFIATQFIAARFQYQPALGACPRNSARGPEPNLLRSTNSSRNAGL
jgi:hypothetical protein